MGRRCIGLDVHREFAQVAMWEDGRVRQAGQIAMTAEALRVFADSLGPEDEVAIEATCNTHAIVRLIEPRVDAGGGVEPAEDAGDRGGEGEDRQGRRAGARRSCWRPTICRRCGSPTRRRRRCAGRSPAGRTSSGSARRLKNQVQSILHRNLVPRCPAADLFGIKGRVLAGEPAAAGR